MRNAKCTIFGDQHLLVGNKFLGVNFFKGVKTPNNIKASAIWLSVDIFNFCHSNHDYEYSGAAFYTTLRCNLLASGFKKTEY